MKGTYFLDQKMQCKFQKIDVMKIAYLISACILFTGCATFDIYSDYDHAVDFRSYKTYAWLPNPDKPYKNKRFNNQIMEGNVKNYAGKEMEMLGYRIELDSPDLLLEYNFMIEKKTSTVETPIYSNQVPIYPYPYAPYPYNYRLHTDPFYDRYHRYSYGYAPPPYIIGYKTDQIPYKEGTLTISVIDRKDNKLIWRGWSVSTVTNPESYSKDLPKILHDIFAKYPLKQLQDK
jgi:hypothetical protein